MYKNFTLTESEREDILNQHSSYGYRQPLNEQSLSKPGDADVKGMVKTVNQNTQAADARKKLAYDLAIKAKDIKMGDRVSVSNDTSLGYFDSWDGKVIKIEPTAEYGLGFTLLGANSQTYYFAESMVQKIENPEPKNWSIVVSSFKRQDLRTL